jgi:DNA-binding response OmpR family regulator
VQSLLPSLDEQYYRDAHLFVHLRHQMVMLDGQAITLTRMQHRLLALLVQHAGEVVPRTVIWTQVWGSPPETRAHTLDVHIRGLRKKLGPYGAHFIETVVRIGYRFRPFLPRD